MTEQFEFTEAGPEAHFVVVGSEAARVTAALFGGLLTPGQLLTRRWPGGGETEAAACWLPPDRLEIRVPLAAAPQLRAALSSLAGSGVAPFPERVRSLIARLEAWSYADSDSGSGPAEALANDLRRLATEAPPASRRAIKQAQDALDDGLPAEVIIGTLDRALRETEGPGRRQASGLGPSASG
ncbi:MAG: hypothetical protein M3Z11_10425 [Candidatus Dormibacteraeota bacterium]|nr:hypothetical protein [Candidatus Dormibacteraeota bacterium]